MSLTDLIEVSVRGDLESLQELLDQESLNLEDQSIINLRNKQGKSALDMAAMLGNLQIVQELIARGADFNSSTDSGFTALHLASSWGKASSVKALIEAGADLHATNHYGERPKECATRYGQEQCVKILEKSEARIELKTLAQSYKDIIADPEKNMGRLNKEDRIVGNRACDEKLNWLENNKDSATAEQITQAKTALEDALRPIMAKLKDPSDAAVSVKSKKSLKSPSAGSKS